MITICLVHFRCMTLAALRAALYSVRQQDLSNVSALVVVDNNTTDSEQDIRWAIDELDFPVFTVLRSFKHGDDAKTHSWSTNVAVGEAPTPWVIFTRADYLLDFDLVRRFSAAIKHADWNGFVTANVYHLAVDLARCEEAEWRLGTGALRSLPGSEETYTCIDAGVWMARRETFHEVGGLGESLSAWGHAQTHFQYKLHMAGVECVRIPEPLFYHPRHNAPRDMALAHQQLRDNGINLKEMWARSHVHPYGR